MRPAEAPPLRLTLGASRLAVVLYAALGFGAAVSLLLSDMPVAFAWPVALACVAWGTWLAWRERGPMPITLVVGAPRRDGAPVPVHLDAVAGHWTTAAWRGPLCVMTLAVEGRARRLVLWPDVAGAAVRRELRLRAPRRGAVGGRASMAP